MPAQDTVAIERDWRTLESLGQTTFFQSWEWIGSLLESVPPASLPDVLRVSQSDRLVGICLLWPALHRRRGFVRSRSLHLNETGDPEIDRLTIEHNGVLSAPGMKTEVAYAILRHLSKVKDWDEVQLGGLGAADHTAWQQATLATGLLWRIRWDKETYFVDLDQVRSRGDSYLSALSANTRYQARRAMRRCGERGALLYETASTVNEAIDWLRCLADLHQAQWTSRGQQGAFGSEFANRFHRRLVTKGWSSGRVILARVSAGPLVLGYLYNFVRDGVVYNYQSGHVAERDPQSKPGLVCHCLAVEDALQRQYRSYDMLMGGGHFKSSLTTGTDTLYWASVQRRRLALQLETVMRAGRDLFRTPPAPAAMDCTVLPV